MQTNEISGVSDQSALDRSPYGRRSGAHSELSVDGAQVVAHRAGAQVEPLCNLIIAQPFGDKAQNLELSGGECTLVFLG